MQLMHSPINYSTPDTLPNLTTPTEGGGSVIPTSLSSLQGNTTVLHKNHRVLSTEVTGSCQRSLHGKDSNNGKLTRRKGESPGILTNGIAHDGYHDNHGLIDLPATPEEIRTEVESLVQDVISRVKQLLFNSVLCTYYTTYIPLQFVEVRVCPSLHTSCTCTSLHTSCTCTSLHTSCTCTSL